MSFLGKTTQIAHAQMGCISDNTLVIVFCSDDEKPGLNTYLARFCTHHTN